MNSEWSLDVLYKGFDDPKFSEDLISFEKKAMELSELSKKLSHENEGEDLLQIVKLLEEFELLEKHLSCFGFLSQSTNTADAKAAAAIDKVATIASTASKAMAIFSRYIADIQDLNVYLDCPELCEYKYFLNDIHESGKYLLSEDVEEALAKMNISGGSAWEKQQSLLTSSLEVEYDGKKLPLASVRNLAYDANKEVRKAAYEAEVKSYAPIADAVSFSLNNIKLQVITEANMRGYESPMDMTLHQSHVSQKTLDALLSAMQKYLPVFHKYLKRKAEMLGYENGLPWYELFAPIGKSATTSFTPETAKTYLVDHFRPFSDDLADMMEEAFDKSWIDFYPHKGKVGGAFCCNMPFAKQSRVLTNFDGGLGDVVTLAHELGHAYHGLNIESHKPLNWEYSMPVAETASTFNENIIMNAVIDETEDKEVKLGLIENQLQDLCQIICDIYSRYLFEKAVFDRRSDEFMFADQLNEIMLDAQKQAYGDGLDPNCLHPYMWVCKSHYYSSDLSYYNWPYAFGGLFARGLVVKYQEMGKEKFVPKYKEMLHTTTVASVEDTAKVLDIDLTDEAFWISALETAKSRIDEFIELSKEVK